MTRAWGNYYAKKKPAVAKKVADAVQVPSIELDARAKEAIRLMEHTSEHIFLTGRAGTGKSTLLQYLDRKSVV